MRCIFVSLSVAGLVFIIYSMYKTNEDETVEDTNQENKLDKNCIKRDDMEYCTREMDMYQDNNFINNHQSGNPDNNNILYSGNGNNIPRSNANVSRSRIANMLTP